MKKLLIAIIIFVIPVVLQTPFTFATSIDLTADDDASNRADGMFIDYIVDNAQLLTESERQLLEQKAVLILDEYECEARIVTADSIGFQTAEQASNAYYRDYNLGVGPDRSCAMILINMENRKLDFARWGFADYAFTEYAANKLLDNYVVPLLSQDKYYEAFDVFLDRTEEYMAIAKAGTPLNRDNDQEELRKALAVRLVVSVVVSLLISGVVCFIWLSQMKSAKLARTANQYIPSNGFVLMRSQDLFLYRTQTRIRIQSSGTARGGGGSSSSSGGGSHSGRGF